jgi:hypothetical protein
MIAQPKKQSSFDFDAVLPPGATILVYRFANRLRISNQHVRNLIEQGEIKVPVEEIESARSKTKTWTTVKIPRESAIDFLRRRFTGTRSGVKKQRKRVTQ